MTTRQDLIAHGQTLAAGAMALTGSRIDLADSYTQAREITLTANRGDISTQRATVLALDTLSINTAQTLNNQGARWRATRSRWIWASLITRAAR